MKRLAPIVLALVACTQQPPAPAPAPAVAPSWRTLDLTGATWHDILERMSTPQRAAVAYELVRDGNLACPRRVNECGMESVDGPRDDERLDAPCLRRRLVEWVFVDAIVDKRRLAVPADILAALARVPDAELIGTVAGALEDRAVVDFLVAAEQAGTPAPYASLLGRPPDVIADAARRHVDAAIAELSLERDRALAVAAIADTAIAPQVRADLLLSLSLEAPDRSDELVAALRVAAADPHCELAARSAEALATFGDRRFLPRAPAKRDPQAFFRAACVLAAGDFWDDSTELAATFVPRGGVVLYGPKGDAFADTDEPSRTTVTAEDGLIPLLRTLVQATCDHATCVDDTTRYELTWTRDGKLARVTVHRDRAAEQKARDAAAACDPGGYGD